MQIDLSCPEFKKSLETNSLLIQVFIKLETISETAEVEAMNMQDVTRNTAVMFTKAYKTRSTEQHRTAIMKLALCSIMIFLFFRQKM